MKQAAATLVRSRTQPKTAGGAVLSPPLRAGPIPSVAAGVELCWRLRLLLRLSVVAVARRCYFGAARQRATALAAVCDTLRVVLILHPGPLVGLGLMQTWDWPVLEPALTACC